MIRAPLTITRFLRASTVGEPAPRHTRRSACPTRNDEGLSGGPRTSELTPSQSTARERVTARLARAVTRAARP